MSADNYWYTKCSVDQYNSVINYMDKKKIRDNLDDLKDEHYKLAMRLMIDKEDEDLDLDNEQ